MNKLFLLFGGMLVLVMCMNLLDASRKVLEGFGDYDSCIEAGYTKSFCVTNPLPGMCLCKDGSLGTHMVGFKGACVCPKDMWQGYFG